MNALSPYTGRPLPGNSRLTGVTAAAPAATPEVRQTLMQMIRPQVRDRWMSTALRNYTPDQVELIIRGAMAGNLVPQWELFNLMEETWPRLLKNLGELKDGALAYSWTLTPWAVKGQDPTPEAQRRADFIEELIWNMEPEIDSDENGFEDTIWDLCDARGKGIAVLETDWQSRMTRFGRAIAPRATRWIHPRYYGYPTETDETDRLMLNVAELAAGRSLAGAPRPLEIPRGNWMRFPEHKFVLGICKSKSGHPIGGALLRTLGFWWAAMNFTGEWFLNYAQLFGQPLRWATFDPNLSRTDQNVLADMLANMGSMAYAMFPTGTQLELKEAAKGAGDNPQMALLNFADKVCDILVLRQTLTTDVADSGSRALGDVHADVLHSVKFGIANWAARSLNRQLIRSICALNFGSTQDCPWLQVKAEEQEDPKANAERDEILIRTGITMPKDWFYERHGIPVPGATDDVVGGTPQPVVDPRGSVPNQTDDDPVQARAAAADQLVDQVLEDLTGVQAKWLGGVKPYFARLVHLAENEAITDAQFIQALESARAHLPELFDRLDHTALAGAMEHAMGAAVVNGAVRGALKRRLPRKAGGA